MAVTQPTESPYEQLELLGVVLHQPDAEPRRALCPCCLQPVIHATVKGRDVIADLSEWLPLDECQSCRHTRRSHPGAYVHCQKCGDSGWFGSPRPAGEMLAIDVAWGDDLRLRIVTERTEQRQWESLHALHVCGEDY
jgi:hypothetical protein